VDGLGPGLRRGTREGKIPKIISTAQEIAYLRALAETGNASLAAERAGVSEAEGAQLLSNRSPAARHFGLYSPSAAFKLVAFCLPRWSSSTS
jgi:hypothetical protein